jgi:hypothetical protein
MLFFEFLAFSQAICVTGIKFFPNRGSVSSTGGVLGVTSDLIASPYARDVRYYCRPELLRWKRFFL